MDDLNILIQKAKKGDQNAYGQIYNYFYKRIFRFCKFNTQEDALAQDICQETFLKAWKSLPTFKLKGGSLQAYLFRIARNLLIDHSRKKKEEKLENYIDKLEADISPEEQIDRESNIKLAKKALQSLKEDERQIIVLRYFEEMTMAEVAKTMKLREGNLRVKTHRILKKLKSYIET